MIKHSVTIVLIFICQFCFSQTELEVKNIKLSECDQSLDIHRIQPRIITQSLNNHSFTIAIGTVANCIGISKVRAFLSNDTIVFSYIEWVTKIDTIKNGRKTEIRELQTEATCDCCFEFEFTVGPVYEMPKHIMINNKEFFQYKDKYKIYPVKFEIINGDTLNFIDKYGSKQGKWNKIENDIDFEYYELGKFDFNAFYIDDYAKTAELKEFYPNNKLKFSVEKTDFETSQKKSYYENGQLEYQEIDNEFGSIFYCFYVNGAIKSVKINTKEFEDEQIYYENGNLQRIVNKLIYQEFYSNGVLKYERLYSTNKDNIWAKYFYDNGKIMCIYYLQRNKDGFGNKKNWKTYFDINGKKVSKEKLIKLGYEEILDM